jgi:histidine kinase
VEPEILGNMLQKIDTNVDRATRIIVHMRQFARKTEASLDRVQLVEVLERAVDIFSQQLKVRGIDLEWNVDPELPTVVGDPGRLEQVFINLLLNARDAIEAKTAGNETGANGKRISISVKRQGEQVVVEITDTGIGIPREIQEKIFEPFFTTKEVGKGTGLGLSISYGIVKECGGTIQVRSETGQGATFTLNFPVRESDDETIDFARR